MKKIKSFHFVLLAILILLSVAFILVVITTAEDAPATPAMNSNIYIESSSEPTLESSDEVIDSDMDIDDILSLPEAPPVFELPPIEVSGFTEEETARITAVLEKYGEGVSVFFEDIHSGAQYAYNQDEKYFIASVIKAPYCMYLYNLASKGECDLEEPLTMLEEIKQEGTGKLKDIEAPADFTVRELIGLALTESDNTAMKMLLKKYPAAGYIQYARGLGLTHMQDIKYVDNGDITARDAGAYAKAIYNFTKENEYGEELRQAMSGRRNAMIYSKYPIARKYGWAEKSFHDMAVVYAPHPYVLAICTNKDEGTKEDFKLFSEVSAILEQIMLSKYADAQNEN